MFQPNPVAFTIFGISVNWYGILIAAAVLLAIWLSGRAAKRQGYDPDIIIDCALLAVPLGVIGGRLYYVIFEWEQYSGDLMRIFDIRSGGLAIYGAVIMGMVAVWIFSKWKKIPFFKVVDFIVPSLILAQGIGRWGNFFNQEAFGELVTNPSLQFFPYAVYISALGQWHQATFFYESVWCIAMFFVLWAYQRRTTKDGNVFALYLVVYGFERMIVEGMRTDSLYLGGMRVSQVLSAIVFLAAGLYLLYPQLNRLAGKIAGAKAPAKQPADAPAVLQENQTVPEPVEAAAQDETGDMTQNESGDAAQAQEPISEREKTDGPETAQMPLSEGGFEVAQSLLDELETLKKQEQENKK